MSYQQGKSRLYPRYSLNSSDNEDTPIHRSIYAQPYNSQLQSQQQQQQQQQQLLQLSQQQIQTNLPIVLGGGSQSNSSYSYRSGKSSGIGSGSGLHQQITTPSSDNGSSATLTDAEAALARENTLLDNNGRCKVSTSHLFREQRG
ncbi:myosin-G heavy chain [Ochlerotatus camptorhynchus]|uniref:myosin-G heavy chain n=1 Tax=Ochlerotatus camptorhynchus TaxID=644619 RepID=UPI0031DD0B0A